MIKIIFTVIRLIASIIFAYLIYKETGFATAIFAFTVIVYIEINDYNRRLDSEYKETLNRVIEKIAKIIQI